MTAFDDMLLRLCDMEKVAIPGSDAVPGEVYTQEAPNYWTNAVGDFQVQADSEELAIVVYGITMTYYGAEITEGYEMQPERSVQTLIHPVVQYFLQRRQLKRTSADAPLSYLHPSGAMINNGRVRRDLMSGAGQQRVGLEFVLQVPLYMDTNQLVF